MIRRTPFDPIRSSPEKTLPMTPHARPSRTRAAAATLLLALAVVSMPTAAHAVSDPQLDQTLEPDMEVVRGERVLDTGHVDMGPKFVDGEWRFLIHDDAAKAESGASSVWRYPDETVMHVLDSAVLDVPDDPAYGFIGAEVGTPVWVVPQTQSPDVVWLGWNTQDPEVMQTIDRGITLSLTGVQGPGALTAYLQSGSFGAPQVLFDSRNPDPQPAWVDVNTHTHANWVFTEPGVYLVRLQADAQLIDGSAVSDSQIIRFAVGDQTTPDAALQAVWAGEPAAETPSEAPVEAAVPDEAPRDPFVAVLLGAIGVVAVALLASVIVVVVRGNRAKRAALAARSDANEARSAEVGGTQDDA